MTTNDKKERLFTVTLTEEQYRHIEFVLEEAARIRCGQLDTSFMDICLDAWGRNKPTQSNLSREVVYATAKEELTQLKRDCWNAAWPESEVLQNVPFAAECMDMSWDMRKWRHDNIMSDEDRETVRGTVMPHRRSRVSCTPELKIGEVK